MPALAEALKAALDAPAKPKPAPVPKAGTLTLGRKPAEPAPPPEPEPEKSGAPALPPYTIRVTDLRCFGGRTPWLGVASIELVIAGFRITINRVGIFASKRPGVSVRLPYWREDDGKVVNMVWLHSDRVAAEIAAAVNAAWDAHLAEADAEAPRP